MFRVVMSVDGSEYTYGVYDDRNRANEIAMQVSRERNICVFVDEM